MNNSMNNVNLEIKRLIIGFLLKEKIQNQTHRWYEEYMVNLETVMECILEEQNREITDEN